MRVFPACRRRPGGGPLRLLRRGRVSWELLQPSCHRQEESEQAAEKAKVEASRRD